MFVVGILPFIFLLIVYIFFLSIFIFNLETLFPRFSLTVIYDTVGFLHCSKLSAVGLGFYFLSVFFLCFIASCKPRFVFVHK